MAGRTVQVPQKSTALDVVRKEKFPGGLVVATETMPNLRSVALGVWLRMGSRHEPEEVNGICHFIEHLLFKGTETRSARDIALTVDSVGGQMDAFTTKEYTCFYFKVLDAHLDVALDLLADIVRHPKFLPEEVEKERKVIYEEIKMVQDTPDEMVYDLFSEAFFGDHPLGRPIQGTIESVAGMRQDQLIHFFRDSYQPGNLMVTASGNLDHDHLVRAMSGAFGGLAATVPVPAVAPPRHRSSVVLREKKELSQLHLCLGVPCYPMAHPRRYQEYVMNTLLGGTMSSRLFQHIREERGLVYSVFSSINAFVDTGNLLVYAATSPESGREVVDLVMQEFRRLKEEPVGEAELQVAKDHLKGSLMLSLESSNSRMSNLARQEYYFGRQFTVDEVLQGVSEVTREQILDLARDLFDSSRCTVALLGQTAGVRLDQDDLSF